MKKTVMSLLFICALAVAGSAQTTQKKVKTVQPASSSKAMTAKTTVATTTAGTNKSTTAAQKTAMVKPKGKHHLLHKSKQKTTK
jgi:hypothetical protein